MYYVQSVENQLKAVLPTNVDTNTITYNEHFVISDNPLRRIAWEVSKVENTTTFGLTKLTFTQELEFDVVDNVSWINFQSNNFSDKILELSTTITKRELMTIIFIHLLMLGM